MKINQDRRNEIETEIKETEENNMNPFLAVFKRKLFLSGFIVWASGYTLFIFGVLPSLTSLPIELAGTAMTLLSCAYNMIKTKKQFKKLLEA